MRLVRLVAHDFRNLVGLELDTDARFVVAHGPNAQGKTNLLEAVWMLSTLRPLRGHRLRDVIAWGADEGVVAGVVRAQGDERPLKVELGAKRRRTLVDGKPTRDLAEYFAWIRAISFTPVDATIVTEGPALRRAWLDRAAFTARPAHLDRVRAFERILAQKAAALRADRPEVAVLDVLDDQLARAGAVLVQARIEMLRELAPHLREVHQGIAGTTGGVGVRFRTDADGDDVATRTERLRVKLGAARRDEVRRHRCLVGPQRDDVALQLDGHAARHFGSRGQVRSLVLSMKLAELVAARARGDRPLFLLDDLSSELDRARTARLVERLVALDTQVFVSTTDPDQLGDLGAGEALHVTMDAGVARPGAPPDIRARAGVPDRVIPEWVDDAEE